VSAAPRAVTLRAADGRALAALLLEAPRPRGAITFNGAAGYPREFYLKFAGYCAARGYHTLVYDYRGCGASALAPLRRDPATMAEWGRLDMPAALEFMARHFAPLPLFTVGHSIGGQLGPATSNQARARAHVMLAASIGYWRAELAPFRYLALFLWRVYGPLTLRLWGYVPHSLLWRGLSLPRGVFLQWRIWCTRPEHFGPDLDRELPGHQFAACRGPLLLWNFSDDPVANPQTAAPLLAYYPNAHIEQRWTSPTELGVRHIGHGGFFSSRHRDSLWRGVLDWIDARGG
jgi:predicted alpha/beta hydrolase